MTIRDNRPMHPSFHLLRRLARLVLVWYMLFVGVSVLAATLQPQTMDVVCSSMGIMKVVVSDDGSDAKVRTAMDCPLCAHATPALPPGAGGVQVHVQDARAYLVQRVPAAVLASRTAPPLPSRGPPDLI